MGNIVDSAILFGASLIFFAASLILLLGALVLLRRHRKGAETHEKSLDMEARHVLLILDKLIEKLPGTVIQRFKRSKDYDIYTTVMKRVR